LLTTGLIRQIYISFFPKGDTGLTGKSV
jgi:hypothetical protein